MNALAENNTLNIFWFSLHHKAQWDTAHSPDIIIAAGSHTHWPALKLRWRYGGKLVVLMKPFLPRCFFDLCFIPRHDGIKASRNVVTTRGAINPVPFSEQSKPDRGLMLIGGPSKHYGWSDEKMVEQLLTLLGADENINWTLTTSRRTPESFLLALQSAVLTAANNASLSIVPLEKTDSAWLAAQYRDCGKIWVTEDSVSMVYESLSSGTQTGILAVPRLSDNRVSAGLDELIREGAVKQLGSDNRSGPAALPLNEAMRAATIIEERLL